MTIESVTTYDIQESDLNEFQLISTVKKNGRLYKNYVASGTYAQCDSALQMVNSM